MTPVVSGGVGAAKGICVPMMFWPVTIARSCSPGYMTLSTG